MTTLYQIMVTWRSKVFVSYFVFIDPAKAENYKGTFVQTLFSEKLIKNKKIKEAKVVEVFLKG